VSSVFAVAGGEVLTPPLAAGILPGITRAIVLGLCVEAEIAARERSLTMADLDAADEVFLTSSVQEIVPVGTLEGRPVAGRSIAGRLLVAYREKVARETAGTRA
jgi:branched-subunit amino acid aminotransferase/4-amino-4-deoxychorismate lyase